MKGKRERKNGKRKQINIKNIIKDNLKLIIVFVIGVSLSSTIAYGATILFASEQVSYDNTTSGMEASNVQSALDELYVESTSYQLFENRVSTLENSLYVPNRIAVTQIYTTQTTLSYTGVSYTIPANSMYTITVRNLFSNAVPSSVGLSQSSTSTFWTMICYSEKKDNIYTPQCTISGTTLSSPVTYYAWASNGTASLQNTIVISGFYLKK